MELDQAALEKLSALAKASEDANRLKASELNILRRKEQEALLQVEETARLRHEVQRLITELDLLAEQYSASIAAQQLVAAQVKALKEQVEHIDNNMLLLLTEKSQPMIQAAIEETSKRKQLRQHYRNLDRLKEQAAKYGEIDVPLKLKNAIEAEQSKIEELE